MDWLMQAVCQVCVRDWLTQAGARGHFQHLSLSAVCVWAVTLGLPGLFALPGSLSCAFMNHSRFF